MRTLTELIIKEALEKFEAQDDTVNYLTTDELTKYLTVTNKFLSADAKNVINWLIEHNDYIDVLARKDAKNALASFINNGAPKDASLKELYRNVRNVIKIGRGLEIPVFQTRGQFNSIINREASLDEIVIDLTTEQGRTEVAKKYDPLVWKIARQYEGKSSLALEDLYAQGLMGLTHAMNTYGKPRVNKSDDEMNKVKSYTFLSYAAFSIRSHILGTIQNDGHMVRIPVSVQSRERKEKGTNTRSNSISIDTTVSTDKEGNKKTLLDKIGDYERAGKSLDAADIENMWDDIRKGLSAQFDEQTLDVFYSHFGVFGHDELTGKELMKKYGFKNQSNINAICQRVFKFIRKDPNLWEIFNNLYELMTECAHEDDLENRDYEPIYFSRNTVNEEAE